MPIFPKLKFVLTSCFLGMILLHVLIFRLVWSDALAGRPDFSIFYTAGLMLRRGQGTALYDNALQWQTQREFTQGIRVRQGPLPYNHPPFEALLFLPFTYLPYLSAYALWIALNLLLLAGMPRFLHSYLPRLSEEFSWLPFLAAVGFFPIAFALMQGQDSILLLLLYALAYAALRSGKNFRAGIWLGLGLFKFHLVLPFAFILLLHRRLRTIGGFLVSGLTVGMISLSLVGWKELLYYPRYVWEVNQHPAIRVIIPQNMPNLRGLVMGWKWNPLVMPWLNGIVFLASVLALCWAASRWKPAELEPNSIWTAGFSIALITTALVGYHGYNQDLSILFLPGLLLFEQLLGSTVQRSYRLALELGLGMLFCSPLYVILTVRYSHQNLFALVLLGITVTLAGWIAALRNTGGHALSVPLSS